MAMPIRALCLVLLGLSCGSSPDAGCSVSPATVVAPKSADGRPAACREEEVEDAELQEASDLRVELLQRARLEAQRAARPDEELGSAPAALDLSEVVAEPSQNGTEAENSLASRAPSGSCSKRCAASYEPAESCQCNQECSRFRSCCGDYKQLCIFASLVPKTALPGGPPYGRHSSRDFPTYPGFTLFLAEEFDEPLDLDNDPIWTYSDGANPDGRTRFIKENIQFSNGMMKLVMTGEGKGGGCSHAESGYVGYKSISGAEFRSRYNMFRYGRYEVRMKAPMVKAGNAYASGNFVSSFFVFRDGAFRHWREIDFEFTGSSTTEVVMHVYNGDGFDKWSQRLTACAGTGHAPNNVRTDFHTFAIEWLPSSVSFFVDGKLLKKCYGKIPEMSTKIIMNLWTNMGQFGGRSYLSNQYPMVAEYDWIRFYKWDQDDKYPCEGMVPSKCLTEEDMYLASNNGCDKIPQLGSLHGRGVCSASC